MPPQAPTANSLEQRLLALLTRLTQELRPGLAERAFGLDDSLEADFGLDSLARVELLARLERELGTRVPERVVFEAESARDLLRHLRAAAPAALSSAAAPAPQPPPRTAVAFPPQALPTLLDVFEWHVERHAERPLLTLYPEDGAEPLAPLSYADLRRDAQAVAAGLRSRGIGAGAAVAIMLPTGRDFFAAFYGTLYAGGVPVPLYPPARPAQLEEHLKRVAGIVANARAAALLTVERARALAGFVRGRAPELKFVGTVAEVALPEAPLPRPALAADAIALLQYTSGSTGDPKGVVLTHANLLASLHAMRRAADVTADDVFVSWLPLYHDMGLIGACLGSLCFGFPLVLMSPLAFLARPLRWLQALTRHGGTISASPNFGYELCVNRITEAELADLDLSRWRLAFNGAEPVSAETIERFAARFARCGFRRSAVYPVYGLAEATLGVTFPPPGKGPQVDRIDRRTLMRAGRAQPARPDDAHPLAVVSCGAPVPGHEVRIVDARGIEAPERIEGRVQFRGPSATRGYFDNPAADAKLFDGDWLASGDLGYIAGGELYLTGREKDVIIRGGFNVHPQELETAIAAVPGVRKGGVAVFPAADPSTGSERLVVVAETHATAPDERGRIHAAIGRLAADLLGAPADDIVLAAPRTVLKTSSGKLRRAACRELYERGALGHRPRSVWWQLARLGAQSAWARALRAGAAAADLAWSAWAWIVFGLVGAACWLAVLIAPTPRARRRAVRVLARSGWRLLGVPIDVRGLERLPRERCIVVANHASYADSVLLTAVLPARFVFTAKEELARAPVFGWPLRRIGTGFVARSADERGREDTRALQVRVESGESLIFYPEGTLQRAPGLLPFKLGAFAVAAATGAAVVPVAIGGTRSLLRAGRWRPQRHRVAVAIGAAIAPAGDDWAAAIATRDAARHALLALTGEPDLGAEYGPQRRVAASTPGNGHDDDR